MRPIALSLVRLYQIGISPWLPRACRFWPTCSSYAEQAVQRYGVWRGGWLALKRLARCHPFCRGGLDPVPERWPSRT